MSVVLGQKNRKLIRDITIKDADDGIITPGANDVVRIKVGRRGDAPLLDLDSAAASANGSTVSKNTPSAGINRVQIDQVDMNLLAPGIYTFEVSLVDNADAQAIKHVDFQIMIVQAPQLGDIGMV